MKENKSFYNKKTIVFQLRAAKYPTYSTSIKKLLLSNKKYVICNIYFNNFSKLIKKWTTNI